MFDLQEPASIIYKLELDLSNIPIRDPLPKSFKTRQYSEETKSSVRKITKSSPNVRRIAQRYRRRLEQLDDNGDEDYLNFHRKSSLQEEDDGGITYDRRSSLTLRGYQKALEKASKPSIKLFETIEETPSPKTRKNRRVRSMDILQELPQAALYNITSMPGALLSNMAMLPISFIRKADKVRTRTFKNSRRSVSMIPEIEKPSTENSTLRNTSSD